MAGDANIEYVLAPSFQITHKLRTVFIKTLTVCVVIAPDNKKVAHVCGIQFHRKLPGLAARVIANRQMGNKGPILFWPSPFYGLARLQRIRTIGRAVALRHCYVIYRSIEDVDLLDQFPLRIISQPLWRVPKWIQFGYNYKLIVFRIVEKVHGNAV